MHDARAGRRPFPSAVAFAHLGPLIRGPPAVPLEEESVFRAAAPCALYAHPLAPHPLACIHSEDLIGVLTSQPSGRVDREAVDGASGEDSAAALQCGPASRGATVARIQHLHRLGQDAPSPGDAFP